MDVRLIAEGSTKWDRFVKRWGISFLVGDDLLFDTFGRVDVFRRNIREFKIDLARIKYVAISHDDWDHIAGLDLVLQQNRSMCAYVCRHAREEFKKTIIRPDLSLMEVDAPIQINGSVFSLGEMQAMTKYGVVYEQALAIKTEKGLSVITGCAHPGIVAIVKEAVRQHGGNLYAVIGGFHMKDHSQAQNEAIVDEFATLGARYVVPLHCTGKEAVAVFRRRFGDACRVLQEGQTIEV